MIHIYACHSAAVHKSGRVLAPVRSVCAWASALTGPIEFWSTCRPLRQCVEFSRRTLNFQLSVPFVDGYTGSQR